MRSLHGKTITLSTGETVFFKNHKEGYQIYLKTKHWKQFREQMKSELKYECFQCKGISSTLQLHHTTYKRIGKETKNDVMWLCNKCHTILHNKMRDAKEVRKKQNKIIQKKFQENAEVARKIRAEMELMDKEKLEALLNHAREINGKNFPRPKRRPVK